MGSEMCIRDRAYIQEVKAAVDVPVTTAEIGGILRNHPAVIDAIDLIMIHIYPFWDRQSIDGAVNEVVQTYLQWRDDYPNKRIVIGETGWPSDGPTRGQAVPNPENQRRFFYEFLAAAEQHDIEFYYFDAFDELWKREGGVGSHWGYDYADRTGKYEVQSVLIPKQHLFHWVYLPSVLKDGQAAAVADRPSASQRVLPESQAFPSVQEASEDEFVVFDEYCAEENHFAPSGWMGDWGDLDFYECERSNPYTGQVSIRVNYAAQGSEGWTGIYWQEPDGNWGTIEGAGYDLDDATYLRFYARGAQGGEQVKFLMGGIWNPEGEYPDSLQPALSTDVITLTQEWLTYTIDLRGRDLSYVIGGFGFVTDQCLNSEPITFYLDYIHYVLDDDPGAPTPTPTPNPFTPGFSQLTTVFGTGTDFTQTLALADVDRDGDLDLAAGNWNGQANRVYRNDGDGTFTDVTVVVEERHAGADGFHDVSFAAVAVGVDEGNAGLLGYVPQHDGGADAREPNAAEAEQRRRCPASQPGGIVVAR